MGSRYKQDLDLNPFFLPGKSQRQKEPGGAVAPPGGGGGSQKRSQKSQKLEDLETKQQQQNLSLDLSLFKDRDQSIQMKIYRSCLYI